MAIRSETELYQPIKTFFEQRGYVVRGEVGHCDLVAVRGEEEPVIVELKKKFNLPLLVQGLDRLVHTRQVYLAVEQTKKERAPHGLRWSDITRVCRSLGLGLITVRFYKTRKPAVDLLCDPVHYPTQPNKKQAARLVNEFKERSGDYNTGGSSRKKLVTAYREKALHCAYLLQQQGSLSPRQLREMTGSPKVSTILQQNFYHWFERVTRGIYQLTAKGAEALEEYSYVIQDKFSQEAP